jgi:antitoxin (DNA-binding transcriptional repressor) of toxin-antitoxin stability system
MAKKSEKHKLERLSATEASRAFSRLLDEVEAGGRFLVQRRGRNVCVIGPPPRRGRSAAECLALLRERAPVLLDEDFGADLLDAVAGEPPDERPSWDS